ncbi:uncharacterized protein LOC117140345 [Drosophila mauritiana]|uniref:Uncharacterized protein LOC117140345 n=1 Tax=Drosophila mauritiana TaxID=7226 RepID=A0A6P8K3M1_DROMA|nr:uncharacterized protein LOC117140345 [Drosophila mauritiana]
MLMEESTIPNIPNEVINYVEEQHARHRELTKQKKSLKKCIKKVQGMLKMIEGRNDGLPCTIAAGNIYQQCTVQELRLNLTAKLTIYVGKFVKVHRKLLGIHWDLSQDYETICENANSIDLVN